MDIYNQNNKCYIEFDLIKKSLNENEEYKEYLKNINVDKFAEFSTKFECFFDKLYSKKQNSFRLFKRNIMYFIKNIINRIDIKLKKNNYENTNIGIALLLFIIPLLKIFLGKKEHKNIQKIFSILIKCSSEKILSYEFFILIIEIILNSLMNLLQINNDKFYYINEEPYNIINDIIISLISYQEEIN